MAFREVFLFFSSPLSGYVSLAADPQCGLQIRRKLYCLCFAVIQYRLQIRLSSLLHYQGDYNLGVFTVCTVSQGAFKSSQVDFRVLPKLIIIIGCLGQTGIQILHERCTKKKQRVTISLHCYELSVTESCVLVTAVCFYSHVCVRHTHIAVRTQEITHRVFIGLTKCLYFSINSQRN